MDLFATSHDTYPDMQSYLPPGNYYEGPFSAAMSTFDSYQSMNAFAQVPHSQEYVEPSRQVKSNAQRFSPDPSPVSASQSFEMAPPQLTASSESGASAQSASSSALASPTLHAQTSFHQDWSLHGMQTVPQDAYSQQQFQNSSFGSDVSNKLPGCVGESSMLPSSSRFNVNRAISSVSLSSTFPTSFYPARNASQCAPAPDCYRHSEPLPSASSYGGLPSSFRPPMAPLPTTRQRTNPLLSNHIWPPTPPPLSDSFSPSQSSHSSPFFDHNGGRFVPPLDSPCRFPRPSFIFQSCHLLESQSKDSALTVALYRSDAHQPISVTNPIFERCLSSSRQHHTSFSHSSLRASTLTSAVQRFSPQSNTRRLETVQAVWESVSFPTSKFFPTLPTIRTPSFRAINTVPCLTAQSTKRRARGGG